MAPPEAAGPAPHRRRGVRVAVGLLVTLLAAELAVRTLGGDLPDPQRWSTPETQHKVGQMEDLDDVDVVAVGSSVVDVSVDPSRLGGSTYNAGLGAGTIGMVAAFTRHVVVPELDPDTVVVGISSRELNPNALQQESIEERFFDAPAARHRFGTESLLDRIDRVLSDRVALVRYRSVLRDPDNWIDPEPLWGDALTGSDGLYLGFLDEEYHGNRQVLTRMRDGALRDFEIGERQLGELRDLLTDLRSGGRRVVLVTTPVSRDYVEQYPDGATDHERFESAVSALADEVGVELVVTGVWDDTEMADPLHTNAAGVARLSDLVARALRTGSR